MMASYMTESALTPKANGAQTPAGANTLVEETVEIAKKDFPKWDGLLEQWPSFRGPGGYGVANFTTAPITWDMESGTNIKWKVELSRMSTNSPVIWGNRLFISSADALSEVDTDGDGFVASYDCDDTNANGIGDDDTAR